MQILIYRYLATEQYKDVENTLLATWAHTFGPDYPQVISDPRWTILDGTSERKT